jgi:hypothetical protein
MTDIPDVFAFVTGLAARGAQRAAGRTLIAPATCAPRRLENVLFTRAR